MTRKELEELLTPEEFDRFITNTIENNIANDADVRNYFYSKFVLHDTPEGETYWYKIIRRLEEGRGVKKFPEKEEILKTISDIEESLEVDIESTAIDLITLFESKVEELGHDAGLTGEQYGYLFKKFTEKVMPFLMEGYIEDGKDIIPSEAEMGYSLSPDINVDFTIKYYGVSVGFTVEDVSFVVD